MGPDSQALIGLAFNVVYVSPNAPTLNTHKKLHNYLGTWPNNKYILLIGDLDAPHMH